MIYPLESEINICMFERVSWKKVVEDHSQDRWGFLWDIIDGLLKRKHLFAVCLSKPKNNVFDTQKKYVHPKNTESLLSSKTKISRKAQPNAFNAFVEQLKEEASGLLFFHWLEKPRIQKETPGEVARKSRGLLAGDSFSGLLFVRFRAWA